jgi:hypothetical protein
LKIQHSAPTVYSILRAIDITHYIRRKMTMMDVVDELVKCVNSGDVQGQLALASDDCTAFFEDMPGMPWAAYVKANADLTASFPDFSISGFKKVVSGNKISLVGCVVAGTHTGGKCLVFFLLLLLLNGSIDGLI